MSSTRIQKLSCGVVIVRMTATEPQLLLLKSFTHWDFPKGMQEEGEQPLATALREVREETTINDLQFCWGEDFMDTGPYSKNKVARYFIATTVTEQVSLPVNPTLGHPEHSAWRWVSLDEARQLLAPRLARVLDWAETVCPQLAAAAC